MNYCATLVFIFFASEITYSVGCVLGVILKLDFKAEWYVIMHKDWECWQVIWQAAQSKVQRDEEVWKKKGN